MYSLRNLLSALFVLFTINLALAQNPASLPRTIESGPFDEGHIQGIAVDAEQKYIYYSYTTTLIKTDMQGRIIGSVHGLLGHLGDLAFNVEDGRVYGSLEYKNDAIGQGILKMKQRNSASIENGFYIAIFDVDRITREGMDAERDGIMTTVFLPTVLEDYLWQQRTSEGMLQHRLGCSGIDGIAFGPKMGKSDGRMYLTVGYGVYSDVERTDNDYQVLLQYDVSKWHRYERRFSQGDMHHEGPSKPAAQYFIKTGNTHYGVQNLEYDAERKLWLMAVYAGSKQHLPNYTLFAADGTARPVKQPLEGVPYIKKGKVVPLAELGLEHQTGIRGWMWGVGSTGMVWLGDGYYYLSHNFKVDAGEGSNIRLYRFTPEQEQPFELIK